MGRYAPLTKHLLAQPGAQLTMSFAEVEHVLGTTLPPSAATSRAWWSNNASNNVMTKAWLAAGFRSEQVDLSERTLVFRRVDADAPVPMRGAGVEEAPAPPLGQARKASLFGWMRDTIVVAPGVDLTAPADPDWGVRSDDGHPAVA